MPQYDLDLEQLAVYRTDLGAPGDLDAFWAATLDEARALRGAPVLVPVEHGLTLVSTTDVTFSGFGGSPVRAWLHRPAAFDGPLPTVVRFQGYTAGRGLPHQIGPWVLAGYACLEVDTRGQGVGWTDGQTPDPDGSGPSYPGFLTRGILDPATYYYRRVYTDAVLAFECARGLEGVDPEHVVVSGTSQGGGISLAVAALAEGVAGVMADVPFLSDIPRGARLAGRGPYTELTSYLARRPHDVERVCRTLAYFDAAVLAGRASAPALFSVALMDPVCPPSTVFAAYNAYGGPRQIRVYEFNEHEGGAGHHEAEQLTWLADLFGGAADPGSHALITEDALGGTRDSARRTE